MTAFLAHIGTDMTLEKGHNVKVGMDVDSCGKKADLQCTTASTRLQRNINCKFHLKKESKGHKP